jgi:twitching motility protein PilT
MPSVENDRMLAAQEILVANNAVRNIIRDGKTNQLQTIIQTNTKAGMVPLDLSLSNLVKRNQITHEMAYAYALDREMLQRYLAG